MSTASTNYDAIVLGAGAAGMMCAAGAGGRGRRVLLVDHADRPGKKILISGGGRCNFTNIHTTPECFLSENPHFAKSALGRYQPEDFIALIEQYGIAWHEKTLGQLFCDGSAKQIVAMLEDECGKAGVDLILGQHVRSIDRAHRRFLVEMNENTFTASSLVIATGGPSIPKMGATGFAYDVARRFGLEVITPRPALVPLTLGEQGRALTGLSGVSCDVGARAGKAQFCEALLCTHRGLSGPAILQVSSYWKPNQPIAIDFLPSTEHGWLVARKKTKPRTALSAALSDVLPARLAKVLAELLMTDANTRGELANTPDRVLQAVEDRLGNWQFMPTGTEGFAKAEVTAGGIATSGLSSRTMAAESVPGLYAIGEAVDVTGWLGGYNFQWAWASGWAAGQDI